jgi:hypothetical protein
MKLKFYQRVFKTRDMDWEVEVQFPSRSWDIPPQHKVRNNSWTHPAPYPVGAGGSSTGLRVTEHEHEQTSK